MKNVLVTKCPAHPHCLQSTDVVLLNIGTELLIVMLFDNVHDATRTPAFPPLSQLTVSFSDITHLLML